MSRGGLRRSQMARLGSRGSRPNESRLLSVGGRAGGSLVFDRSSGAIGSVRIQQDQNRCRRCKQAARGRQGDGASPRLEVVVGGGTNARGKYGGEDKGRPNGTLWRSGAGGRRRQAWRAGRGVLRREKLNGCFFQGRQGPGTSTWEAAVGCAGRSGTAGSALKVFVDCPPRMARCPIRDGTTRREPAMSVARSYPPRSVQ
ncbi:hypothetical protein QBC39DRAFT_66087 [Podospora conica]|nr:hypothetical protein QBC39DRAFT_66087 [Schizothecium conicum]